MAREGFFLSKVTRNTPELKIRRKIKRVQSTVLDKANGSLCNLCALGFGLALLIFATQCWRASIKGETAVHCCDPALSVLVMLVSRNVFHVVSVLQSFVLKSQEPKNDCRQLWLLARRSGWLKGPPEVFSGLSNFDLLITMIIVIISGRCFSPFCFHHHRYRAGISIKPARCLTKLHRKFFSPLLPLGPGNCNYQDDQQKKL